MKELIELSFSYQNLIPTILILFVFIYWISVILGALDVSSFDLEIDVEPDIEVDVDTPTLSWLNNILSFFNLGKIPFMVWLTFVAMPLWAFSIIGNKIIANENFFIALLILIPVLILCMLIAKIATMPFVPIFRTLDKGSENISIPGKVCKVIIPPSNGKIGQAEIEYESSFLLIYIFIEDHIILKKGDTALVIEKHQSKDHYLVEPYNNFA